MNTASVLTSGSLVAGFLAILLAADGRMLGAAGAVGAAAVLDGLDGLVARRLSLSGRFGSHLDSLADIVAFGVAPALMLQRGVLHELPVVGTAACLIFVLAGAWRLARFLLVDDRHRFIGLPIPPAGVIAATAVALALPAAAALALTLALALLMVSTLPFPTLAALAALAGPRRRAADGMASADEGRTARPGRVRAGATSLRSRVRRPARSRGRGLHRPGRRARP